MAPTSRGSTTTPAPHRRDAPAVLRLVGEERRDDEWNSGGQRA